MVIFVVVCENKLKYVEKRYKKIQKYNYKTQHVNQTDSTKFFFSKA